MSTRKLRNKHIRKIIRLGSSRVVSLPVELLNSLGWKEKQRVVVKRTGKSLVISDWKPRR